jgi:type I restriction-modification system DNA methylase subunit
MQTHEFDSLIRKTHDYLYANSSIKTPEALQAEVAKIVMVMVALSRGTISARPAFADEDASWAKGEYEKLRKKQPDWDWGSIELDDGSVSWVLQNLSNVDFNNAERDFLGDALEVMRSTDAKRLGGQFFTDQRVTELTLKLLSYNPEKHDFLDICAGTGGFLIPAIKKSKNFKESVPVFGIEIDPKISKLAQSTLSHFAKKTEAKVFQADSLKDPKSWSTDLKKIIDHNSHDRLGSNPPFGTKIKIREPEILNQYELAFQWRFDGEKWNSLKNKVPRAPELLFIERNLQLAKPGTGEVGLILPYQILSGPQLGYIRQWLLLNAQIKAVVDLPSDTFQPWTGTKTSIVIFRKRKKPLQSLSEIAKDPDIFMSVSEHIGHDRRGNPIVDSSGEIKQDLIAISKAFELYERGKSPESAHAGSFVISPAQIIEDSHLRINAAFYNPASSNVMSSFKDIDNKDFTSVPLGDLVEKVFCPGRFKRSYVEAGGVPFLGGSNISQYALTTEKALSADDPHLDDLIVKKDWILVTRSGSTGIVSRVPKAWDGYAVSEHVIRIIPNKKMMFYADYVETFLRSKWGQDLLAMGVFGSVIDEITPEFISELPIPVPKDLNKVKEISKSAGSVTKARDIAAEGLINAQEDLEDLLKKLIN